MAKKMEYAVQNDHIEAEAEHVFWLQDAEAWSDEHRNMLRKLMQAQSAVLEQDAALGAHIREIYEHDKARLRHELAAASSQTRNAAAEAEVAAVHRRLEVAHGRARAAHGRMRAHHQRLGDLVESLLEAVREPM